MPRTKVPPQNRRRVARACDDCRRRKEKCDGVAPCGQCRVRMKESTCQYAINSQSSKRPIKSKSLLRDASLSAGSTENELDVFLDRSVEDYTKSNPPQHISDGTPAISAPVPKFSRMLRDGKGKFIYIGDSSSLSFLQTIRRAFEGAIGSCDFTTDTLRHRMIETTPITRFGSHQEPQPDLATVLKYAQNSFLAVSGILDLFDRSSFMKILPGWVDDPSRREWPKSPVIYLVLAIGAQGMAGDDTDEGSAEQYFGYGRQLAVSTLMEDPSLLTVQAFTLITYYMVAACRRNGAFINLGVATQGAYALGIHRHETNTAYQRDEGVSRERAWKSLRVCDLFLSSSMGRPPATSETNCSIPWASIEGSADTEEATVSAQASSAIFRICHIFERILNEVYSSRTVSLELAASISEQHREWTAQLPKMLKIDGLVNVAERDAAAMSSVLGSRIVIMAYYYSIILLTRPFLTFQICSSPKTNDQSQDATASFPNVSTYADACIDSAIKGIDVAHDIVFDEMMPKRSPLIINSVFMSALSLGLAYLGDYDRSGWPLGHALDSAINILRHFGPLNPQSARYAQICKLLQEAAVQYTRRRDGQLVYSTSKLVRNVFGGIQDIPESVKPRTSTQHGYQHAHKASTGANLPSGVARQSPPTEIMSPESMKTTTDEVVPTQQDDHIGYQNQDFHHIEGVPYDFCAQHSAFSLNDFSFGNDIPLFSLVSDEDNGGYEGMPYVDYT